MGKNFCDMCGEGGKQYYVVICQGYLICKKCEPKLLKFVKNYRRKRKISKGE